MVLTKEMLSFTGRVEAAIVEDIATGRLFQLLDEFELLSEWGDAVKLCFMHEPPDATIGLWQVDLLGSQVVEDMSE